MNKRTAAQRFALVLAELLKGPTTICALCVAIGVPQSRSDQVQRYVRALRAVGAVRIGQWVNRRTPVLELQSAPFALPDSAMPALRHRSRKKTTRQWTDEDRFKRDQARFLRQQAAMAPGPNSVFALGAIL